MANILDTSKRAQILSMLVDAGNACVEYHGKTERGVKAERFQCYEIRSLIAAKQKNVKDRKALVDGAGDTWTWTAIDVDSKLIISYLVGGRGTDYASEFMDDVAAWLANRVQLTTDSHKAYLEAFEGAFGADVDYAMLIKMYDNPIGDNVTVRYSPSECVEIKKNAIEGKPEEHHVSKSYVEQMHLNIRMGNRRFTHLTMLFQRRSIIICTCSC